MRDYQKVKILRADKRVGLIKARLMGAAAAKASVLTFFDSHIECTTGWLEPLLDRIVRNSTTVPWPIIDLIDAETFEYAPHTKMDKLLVGGFDWSLTFRWTPLRDAEKQRKSDPSEPSRSPTMAGGLFSIDKAFFEKLGTYDPDFDIWGAENLELSFKIWMCGGSIETIPCSHVGHIFRDKSPYTWRDGVDAFKRNRIRLAEVWLDLEYRKYFYARVGNESIDFGDISERVQLKSDLHCKSFDWYMKTIHPEMRLPEQSIAHGEVGQLHFRALMSSS